MKNLRTFEEFELPLGRTNTTKNLALDTFLFLEDMYNGVLTKFNSKEDYNEISIEIPEVLKKEELFKFYDEVLSKKVDFLESRGIEFLKPGIADRIEHNVFLRSFKWDKPYKKCWYTIRRDETEIKFRIKKY